MVSKKTILKVLTKMQEYFGYEIKPGVIQIYIENLQNMEENDFRDAAVQIMLEFKPTSTQPFPLLRDFREAAGLDGKTMAVNAVARLRAKMEAVGQYDSVTFNDPALHSVIQRYGGWVEMVLNNTDKWWSFHERNFIQAYESAKKAGIKGPERLIGLHEAGNTMNGYTPKVLVGMNIPHSLCGFSDVYQEEIEYRDNIELKVLPKNI